MVTLNEPQVWTLISVFSVAIFGMLAVVSGLFAQLLRAEIGKVIVQIDGLRGEVDARFDVVDARFDGVNGWMDGLNGRIDGLDQRMDSLRNEVNGRIDGLSTRFDALDRDVQAIARRVFPEPE
jgi:hypothetical protein